MAGTDPIDELMCSYLDISGMLAAILVSNDGLVINCAMTQETEIETISALVIDVVTSAQRFGVETSAGRLDTMTIEFEGLSLLLAPFEQDVMMALVAIPGTFALQGVMPGV